MRQSIVVLAAGAAGLAACSQPADNQQANQAAAAPKEKIPYCFFKEEDTKAWAASTDKDGNIVVKGMVYRQDPRYKVILEKPKVEGATAEVWPTIVPNDTGYAAPDNWWDVKFTIPGSAAATTVKVRCGAKTFATLAISRTK